MKLYRLSDSELGSLHKALTDPDSPFGLRRLMANVPANRLRFSLEAFEVSGMLSIEVDDATIRISAPYALEDKCIVVNRSGVPGPTASPASPADPESGEAAR
jgi:hypothetical protein